MKIKTIELNTRILFLFIFCLLTFRCTTSDDKRLNKIYSDIEANFKLEKLFLNIKNSEQDSLFKLVPLLISEVNYLHKKGLLNEDYDNIMENEFAELGYKIRNEVFIRGFHKSLNSLNYRLTELINETKKQVTHRDKLFRDWEQARGIEINQLIIENCSTIDVDERVILNFQLEKSGQNLRIVYNFSGSYIYADDSTQIKAKVVEKVDCSGLTIEKLKESSLYPRFIVKVIEIDKLNVLNSNWELIKINDTLTVLLDLYGRRIKN